MWSNLQVLLLRGSLIDQYVVSANLYMALSSFLGLGLENSAVLLNNLV